MTAWVARQVKVPFADPRRSYTHAFERYALELSRRMTIHDVAQHLGVGWDVIKDIQKRRPERRFAKPKLKHLRQIAIDEIAIGKGHRYLTVVLNLEQRRGGLRRRRQGSRCPETLLETAAAQHGQDRGSRHGHVGGLPRRGRTHLPTRDRLRSLPRHQAVQRQAQRLRRNLYREATDLLHKNILKGPRWLLLKNPENLDEKRNERDRLDEALRINLPLATAYYMKEDLRQIWEQKTRTDGDGEVAKGWDHDPPAKAKLVPVGILMVATGALRLLSSAHGTPAMPGSMRCKLWWLQAQEWASGRSNAW